MQRLKKLIVLIVFDLFILFGSFGFSAFCARSSGGITTTTDGIIVSSLVLIAIYLLFSISFRCHLVIWRYSTERDQAKVFLVVTMVGIAFCLISRGLDYIVVPFGFYVLATLLSATGTTIARVIYKIIARRAHERANTDNILQSNVKRLVVVGAGFAGTSIVDDAMSNPSCGLRPVAFVDDDAQKYGRTIRGVKVEGKVDDISEVCKKNNADVIYIAMPSATNAQRARILDCCAKTNLPVKILPYLTEFGDDKTGFLNKIRDITPEELLGREPIDVADKNVFDFVSSKTVAVTGGGGSIGSELCRQIARHSPKRLVIIDIYENNAYAIQQELKMKYGEELNLQIYIASVRDRAKIDGLFKTERPDIVFHAAAHKHVPLMEVSPDEAVKNNVFGTFNTALAAKNNNVSRFILVSTDKAVNPTNCMGASKRVCEMVIQYFNGISNGSTTYAAVRFGNVLGSNGSVIPLFKEQIRQNRDITVTHPDIIRYFMTIPEASQLVLAAGAMAQGGEIFVLDMGEPVKIVDLAHKMISLAGLVEGRDINIKFTGLRPGEKLFEELLVAEEGLKNTLNKKIFISNIKSINYTEFEKQLERLESVANRVGVTADEVADELALVVTTFKRYVPDKAEKS